MFSGRPVPSASNTETGDLCPSRRAYRSWAADPLVVGAPRRWAAEAGCLTVPSARRPRLSDITPCRP